MPTPPSDQRGTAPAGFEGAPPGRAYRKLLRPILAADGLTIRRAPTAEEVAAITSDEPVRAVLVAELVPGAAAAEAVVGCVRALVRRRAFREARYLVRATRRMPRLREAATAAAAVLDVAYGRFDEAAEELRRLPRESALRLVPAELVAAQSATGVGPAGGIAADLPASPELAPGTLLDFARQTFAHGELGLAVQALSRIEAHRGPLPAELEAEARWLRDWIARAAADPPGVPEGHVAIGVLDYKLPDYRHTSVNIGDYIQTLASLGHLVRHQDLRFHGDPELVPELAGLQARVRPDRRLRGLERDVSVLAVNRDASSMDAVPDGTWTLAFGWYMHSWFRVRYDFPFHPNLRPLFVSFHINRPGAFTEDGWAYLRKYAPIGCRDWHTVRRLLALEIPAFFSGCLTSTVDLLFPAVAPSSSPEAPVALVEAQPGGEPPANSVALRHSNPRVRDDPLPANLRRAEAVLDAYRRDYTRVVTSRLHCYLPARALGVEVEFQPRLASDTRFEGLIGAADESFAAMQAGIRGKLEVALSAILRGAEESEVRTAWRDACADDVAAARRKVGI